MGDFERTFGAGADAVAIIDGYSSSWLREQREDYQLKQLNRGLDDSEAFYCEENVIIFHSYEAVRRWDLKNPGVPFVRSRTACGAAYQMTIRR